jgi:hypothetical protein
MDDERVLSLEDMPGWDKYTADVTPDTTVTPPDSGTTRIATAPRLLGTATTIGIFDMNGHYVGLTTQGLPQGRYVIRKQVQGHVVNTVYLKK